MFSISSVSTGPVNFPNKLELECFTLLPPLLHFYSKPFSSLGSLKSILHSTGRMILWTPSSSHCPALTLQLVQLLSPWMTTWLLLTPVSHPGLPSVFQTGHSLRGPSHSHFPLPGILFPTLQALPILRSQPPSHFFRKAILSHPSFKEVSYFLSFISLIPICSLWAYMYICIYMHVCVSIQYTHVFLFI